MLKINFSCWLNSCSWNCYCGCCCGNCWIASRIGDWSVLEETTLSDHRCIEFNLEQRHQAVDKGRVSEGRSPSWNARRLCRERLRVYLEATRLIDKRGWVEPAGSLEDTVRSTRQKVVAACDYSMPRSKRRQAKGSMYWWNDQLASLRRECLAARWRFTRSKGDSLLHKAWKKAKAALRRGIKKSRLQCWKDLIGEVEKDPWGLAFKIVTKKLVTRRKTPGLDNPNQVKYIVRTFNAYLKRFKRDEEMCYCCDSPVDNAEHALFVCAKWGAAREALGQAVGAELTPDTMVSLMLQSERFWTLIESFVTLVMRTRELDGRRKRKSAASQFA